jgi:hypothetical protein
MSANSGTITPIVSANSLQQQMDSGPANNADGETNASLNGSTKYANNAAAVAAGLTAGSLYIGSSDPYPICIVQ